MNTRPQALCAILCVPVPLDAAPASAATRLREIFELPRSADAATTRPVTAERRSQPGGMLGLFGTIDKPDIATPSGGLRLAVSGTDPAGCSAAIANGPLPVASSETDLGAFQR